MFRGSRSIRLAELICGFAMLTGAPSASADPALPPGFQDEVVFGHLNSPANFRFAADGRVFVALREGRVMVFENLEDRTPEVFVDVRTDVYNAGDRGLLGMALDPKFDEGRPYVYLLYAYDHILGDPEPPPKWGQEGTVGDACPDLNGGDACLVSGRLVRLTAEGNHAKEEPDGEPVQEVLAEGWCQQFSSHSIGDLRFGPEGDLYVSGGDGASFTSADYGQFGTEPNPCGDPPGPKGTALTPPTAEGGSLRSQNVDKLNGKILRVDPDTGKGVPGNPLASDENENAQRIVGMGFRNPFRFTINPTTGEIFTDNVGSSEIEELDHFAPSPTKVFNSGWPCYEGDHKQAQFKVLGLDVCEKLYEEEEQGLERTTLPLFQYTHLQPVVPGDECPTEYGSALGGISFYEGNSFPSKYKGALFFTDTVRGCMYVMFPGADGEPDPATAMRFLRENRIYPAVDIEEGPEGNLFYADLTSTEPGGDGSIHRITYAPGAPTARLEANPPYGQDLPLSVTFDASASSDPTSEPLEFEWDLNGNGSFETAGGSQQTLEFTQAELEERAEEGKTLNRTVAVRVTDGEGLSSVARVTAYPGEVPPTVKILEPLASAKWGVGDVIHFSGTAANGKEETLNEAQSYDWTTRLLHCPTGPENCHAHPLGSFYAAKGGEFIAPEHDYPSYIEITLRAVDYRGLTSSQTIKLAPRTVELDLESSPPGVELSAGLLQGPSPFTMTAIEGSHELLSAPATAMIGGQPYHWTGWSDGGERIHVVLADKSRSIVAEYTADHHQLVVTKSGNGSGAVVSSPVGIECGVSCSASFDDGSEVVLTATPDPGSAAATWSGCDLVLAGNRCAVALDGARSVGAAFDLENHRLGPPTALPIAPVAKISGHPPKRTSKRTARFRFSSSQSGAGFICGLGASREACRSPKTFRHLRPGKHLFTVIPVSREGLSGAPVKFRWTVLSVRPRG